MPAASIRTAWPTDLQVFKTMDIQPCLLPPVFGPRLRALAGPEVTRQLADAVTRSWEKTQSINIQILQASSPMRRHVVRSTWPAKVLPLDQAMQHRVAHDDHVVMGTL